MSQKKLSIASFVCFSPLNDCGISDRRFHPSCVPVLTGQTGMRTIRETNETGVTKKNLQLFALLHDEATARQERVFALHFDTFVFPLV